MYQASYKKLLELRTALRKQMDECVFTEKDESAFMDLCRNMTNRLHGIYNMEDQTMIQ
jgi:SPX domain protein involved in polyphosphate accumulation